ncbi:hypothetical protein H8959_014012 [Pygathrix nigripes]
MVAAAGQAAPGASTGVGSLQGCGWTRNTTNSFHGWHKESGGSWKLEDNRNCRTPKRVSQPWLRELLGLYSQEDHRSSLLLITCNMKSESEGKWQTGGRTNLRLPLRWTEQLMETHWELLARPPLPGQGRLQSRLCQWEALGLHQAPPHGSSWLGLCPHPEGDGPRGLEALSQQATSPEHHWARLFRGSPGQHVAVALEGPAPRAHPQPGDHENCPAGAQRGACTSVTSPSRPQIPVPGRPC